MKKNIKFLLPLVMLFGLSQFIRPDIMKNQMVDQPEQLSNVPEEVADIIKTSCFNCHSSSAKLSWFDKVTPLNFFVSSHITEGRKALDFSDWDSLPTAKQKGILYYSLNKVLAKEMPLPSYTWAHPSAKPDQKEIQQIKDYLVSISPRKMVVSAPNQVTENEAGHEPDKIDPTRVEPAPNGIAYMPDYRNWKAISTTDRFDNGTMRIIFGNDIVVAAIKAGQTNPWPDGSILAKTAWQQHVSTDGNISTGKFIQVEFMIKDSKEYAKTEGWGWARWVGNDLKPYGNGPMFSNECITCHRPVKNNDNVFTKPLNFNVTINTK